MSGSDEMAAAVRATLEQDPAIDLHDQPRFDVGVVNGTVLLQGEVRDVGVKRRIAHRVSAMPGVLSLSDRLRVVITETRADGIISNTLHARLASEPEFSGYRIQLDSETAARQGAHEDHTILIGARNGAVTLAGAVGSLSHRRFADVLAWWTPGVADVENRLHVQPPEDDSDDEITDALRLVFETDPSLDASRLRFATRQATVRLEGLVYSAEQKCHAELDAWCVLGVHAVDNRIEVRSS